MLESLLNLLHRLRPLTLLVGVLLFAAGVWNLRSLSVNDRPERWMPRSAVENFERFTTHFESGDTIVFGLEFQQGVRDRDLEYLKTLRSALEQIPGINRVIDASIAAEFVERTTLTSLLQTPPKGEDDPYEIYRGLLFDDPREWRNVHYKTSTHPSQENRTMLVVVETDTSTDPALSRRKQLEQLDARRRKAVTGMYEVFQKHHRDDVIVHPAGALIIQYELERIARGITVRLVPFAVLLMLVSLGWGFRSIYAVLIAVLGGGWAVAVLLGAVVLCGWTINVVTVGAPVLMIVITLSSTVHFAHYYAAHYQNGSGAHRPQFVRWVAVPCCGAALTTGFGFLMLSFNELEPMRELGVELFAGSVLAFVGAYLAWLALPPWTAAQGKLLSSKNTRQWGESLIRRPKTTMAFVLPLLAAMAYFATRVSVDADPFSFFEKENRVAQALDHFSSRKFGHYMLDVVLIPTRQEKGETELKALRQEEGRIAMAFQKRIEQRPECRRVISEPNVRQRVGELAQERSQARKQRKFLQALSYDAQIKVLEGTFKNWLVDLRDEGAIRITFLVYDPGTGFRPLLDATRAELEDIAGDRFEISFTGTAASVAVLSEELVGATSRGLTAAMATMALVCVVLFRSVRLTLIAFLPNVFPILMVFAVMGVFGIPLNSGSAMVATIALGVGLNDTVHFVMHYRRRREEEDTQEALAHTFGEITRPLVLTSIVNCGGFAIFLLSEFRPTHHFGILASIAMAAALAGDLVLLPNLLKIFDGQKTPAPEESQRI